MRKVTAEKYATENSITKSAARKKLKKIATKVYTCRKKVFAIGVHGRQQATVTYYVYEIPDRKESDHEIF